jgi:hypothetical protein
MFGIGRRGIKIPLLDRERNTGRLGEREKDASLG